MASFFERIRKVDAPRGGVSSLGDEQFARHHSTLIELLEARMEGQWGDTNRVSLSLFAQDGLFKAILKDKKDKLALWVSAKTFNGLWKAIEMALLDPDTVWREDRFQGAEQSKRKKK